MPGDFPCYTGSREMTQSCTYTAVSFEMPHQWVLTEFSLNKETVTLFLACGHSAAYTRTQHDLDSDDPIGELDGQTKEVLRIPSSG